MPLCRILLAITIILLLPFATACDPISGDAGTYSPTPQPHGEALEDNIEMVEAAAATREAR